MGFFKQLAKVLMKSASPSRHIAWSKVQLRLRDVTLPWTSLYLLKKYAIKLILFSISIRKTGSPSESIFFVTFGSCEKIEVKRGNLVKKWEFGEMKKILIYQFFKTRICAFMTYGQFLPKSSSNLRFVIRDSRVRGLSAGEAEHLEPLNLRWQISNLSYI